jgi:hypothetical protein
MEQRWLHNDYVQAMAGGTAEKALRQLLERQLEQAKAGCNLRQILEAQLAIEELDRRNDRNERQLLERQVEREREERAKEGVGGPAGVLYKEIDNIGRRGKEQCARAVDERRAQAVRQQLAQMGFAGTDADAALLRACDYDVARVLDRLVEGGAASACSPSAAALRAPRRTRSPQRGAAHGSAGRDVVDLTRDSSDEAAADRAEEAAVDSPSTAMRPEKRRKTEGGGGDCRQKGGGGAKYSPKFGDGPRVALCIGNDKYIGSILPNCVADAHDMGTCCENQLGFDKTIVLTDANKATIMRVVREMRDDHVKDGSLVLVFFSGHGVEHEGVSYLLPIGMESQNEEDLEEEAVSAHWIMKMFSNFTSTVNVLLLDCCRDDELNNTFTKSKGPGDNGAKGFGKSLRSTNRNAEFLVGSACDPGSSALPNDNARNSRYTEALLRHLPAAGRELEKSMKEACKDVFKDTHKKQRPWVSNCLMQDVVLVPAP